MNSVALAEQTGITRQAIEKKRDAAKEKGQAMIEIGGASYGFAERNGRYEYRLVVAEKVTLENLEEDRKFVSYPLEKRKEATLRYEAVRLYLERGAMSYDAWVVGLPRRFDALRLERRQFLRWVAAVRSCPAGKSPLAMLVDKRGTKPKEKGLTKEMEESLRVMILERSERKIKRIYTYMLKAYGDALPSYETIRKYVAAWKEKNFLVYAYATNPDAAVGRYRPAGGNMSEEAVSSSVLWELDATPADIICDDGKRYVLSAAMDVYSRRVVVTVEESSSYSTLAKVLRKGIKKFGVPLSVKTDNGKDYTSNNFAYACSRLGINHVLCPPYSGYYKPHIERFFRTMSHELFEELEGYIGHNVSDREKLQSQMMFAQKLESIAKWKERYKNGDEFAARFAIKKENVGLDVGVPMSRDDLQEWIDRWIVMYENRSHGSLGMSPMQRWESGAAFVRPFEDDRALDILLGASVKRTIRKKGIDWMGITYWHEEIAERVGQSVWVLSDDDMGAVYIYDEDMHYLFTAENSEYSHVSRSRYLASVKKFTAKQAKIMRMLEELRREAPERMKEHILDETFESLPEAVDKPIKKEAVASAAVPVVPAERVEADAKEMHERVEELLINGRPWFRSLFDRFLWDLEHDRFDEDTQRLAEDREDIYEMALRAYEERKVS